LTADAGLRRAHLHDLRPGAASLRLATGTDIAVVSRALGHSSVSITSDTYSHLLAGAGKRAAEAAMAIVPRNQRDHTVTTTAKTAAEDEASTAVMAGTEGCARQGLEPRTRGLRVHDLRCCGLTAPAVE
jgi:hypothetical protein